MSCRDGFVYFRVVTPVPRDQMDDVGDGEFDRKDNSSS